MLPVPLMSHTEARADQYVAHYAKFFIGKGPDYTQGFLDSFSVIGRMWATITVDFQYAGAKFAAEHFKRLAPSIS